MKVLVCGDRNWTDRKKIEDALIEHRATHVVEGDARGADMLGGQAAALLGIPVSVYRADWNQYGRAAGIIRNREQYDKEQPDLVLAFHSDLENSKGTKDMVNYARKQGCRVEVIE